METKALLLHPEPSPHWPQCIFIQCLGGLGYALLIANLSSLVGTMDANAKATKAQLSAVRAYVRNRDFPPVLAKRMRRYFRYLYTQKAAVDEQGIIAQLSTSLRDEVATFLVSTLMNSIELFQSLGAANWAKILPMLKPCHFEETEEICMQGETCNEMLIITDGTVKAKWLQSTPGASSDDEKLDDEKSPKHVLGPGGTLNSLCLVKVWSHCVESAKASTPVDAYAIEAEDFCNQFERTEFFPQIRKVALKAYVFVQDPKAPTSWGRPVKRAKDPSQYTDPIAQHLASPHAHATCVRPPSPTHTQTRTRHDCSKAQESENVVNTPIRSEREQYFASRLRCSRRTSARGA